MEVGNPKETNSAVLVKKTNLRTTQIKNKPATDLHLRLVGLLRVETEALPRPGPTGAACPLLGRGLADGRHQERLHPDTGVVHLGRWRRREEQNARHVKPESNGH